MHKLHYFWIHNDFIRIFAKNLSIYEQMVFVALTCHVGGEEATTFVGCRTIAKELGISKNTVVNAIKKLEAYHLVVRLPSKNGYPSQLKIYPVPYKDNEAYQVVVHKDDIKEVFKEENNQNKLDHNHEKLNRLRERVRNNFLS